MALKRVFSLLAVGGAFMHQSFTHVSGRLDVIPIDIIVYYGHILQVQSLPTESNVIHYLQKGSRVKSVERTIEDIVDALENNSVTEWGQVLANTERAAHGMQWGSIGVTTLALILPEEFASQITPSIVTGFVSN